MQKSICSINTGKVNKVTGYEVKACLIPHSITYAQTDALKGNTFLSKYHYSLSINRYMQHYINDAIRE